MSTETRCAHGLWDKELCEVCSPHLMLKGSPMNPEPVEIAEDLRPQYGQALDSFQDPIWYGRFVASLIERTSKAEAEVRRLRGEMNEMPNKLQHAWDVTCPDCRAPVGINCVAIAWKATDGAFVPYVVERVIHHNRRIKRLAKTEPKRNLEAAR